jgi:hypothetical protein
LKILESDFLTAHAHCSTARQAPEFSVLNGHATEVPAPAANIFPQLGSHDMFAPGPFWKLLLGFRAAIGKLFGWDPSLSNLQPQTIEPGKYFAFFHVI